MFALNVRAAVPARLVSGKKNDAPGFLVIPFKQCLALCANGLGSRVEQDHTRVAILFPAQIALAVIGWSHDAGRCRYPGGSKCPRIGQTSACPASEWSHFVASVLLMATDSTAGETVRGELRDKLSLANLPWLLVPGQGANWAFLLCLPQLANDDSWSEIRFCTSKTL